MAIDSRILATAHNLEVDPFVTLFKIELADGTTFRICPDIERVWQGETFEALPCNMADIEIDSQGKMNRPKFSFANPEGLFSSELYQGKMDNALVSRIRVLQGDFEAGIDATITEVLRVSRIMSIGKQMVTLELRDVLDGPLFFLPAREFIPPEFPHVRLR